MPFLKRNLLLFEDNPLDALLIEETLKDVPDTSYVITSASQLNEGIGLLKKDAFDAILLDLTLPDSQAEILLVEDNPGGVRLAKETLKEGKVCNDLQVVSDGVDDRCQRLF